MPKPVFVDLSHHNTIPESLKPAKESGILGVIHKITEGTGFVDSKVDARYRLAQDAGMLWGLYHFVRPGNAETQAAFMVNTAVELGVCDDDTLFCLDYEDKGVSLNDCVEFMNVVEEMTGHKPVLYSGHVLKEALGGKADPRLSKYRLWLAQYGPDYVLPPGWSKFWGWQYTESGTCPGINPPVDLNAYSGKAQDLHKDWSGARNSYIATKPSKSQVTIMIDAPDDVEVIVKKV